MDDLTIQYDLDDAGWAEITLAKANESVSRLVSYLHDSLLDLVQMALDLKSGITSSIVVFMDEPGEYQLITEAHEGYVSYEFRQYQDWESWGMWPKEDFTLLLSGKTDSEHLINQVIKTVSQIYTSIGPVKYKELWVEHEFPTHEYQRLINA